MGAPIVHWEINTRNASRIGEFYATLFGWKVNSNNAVNYGVVDTGTKKGINGGIAQADPNMPGHSVTFYVAVDNPQAYLDRIQGLGGRTIVPVTEIPGMVTFALLATLMGIRWGW